MKDPSTPSGRPKARCAEGSTDGRETGRGDRAPRRGWSWLVTGVSLFPGVRPGRRLSQRDWTSTLPAYRHDDAGEVGDPVPSAWRPPHGVRGTWGWSTARRSSVVGEPPRTRLAERELPAVLGRRRCRLHADPLRPARRRNVGSHPARVGSLPGRGGGDAARASRRPGARARVARGRVVWELHGNRFRRGVSGARRTAGALRVVSTRFGAYGSGSRRRDLVGGTSTLGTRLAHAQRHFSRRCRLC